MKAQNPTSTVSLTMEHLYIQLQKAELSNQYYHQQLISLLLYPFTSKSQIDTVEELIENSQESIDHLKKELQMQSLSIMD